MPQFFERRIAGTPQRLLTLAGLSTAMVLTFGAFGPVHAQTVPSLSVTDVTVTEATGSRVDAVFQVKLSAASNSAVSVKYETVDASAVSGSDYAPKTLTTLGFAPGQTTKTVPISIYGDALDEAEEKFSLKLTAPVGATIADATGIGTIVDNDTSVIRAIGASIMEGNTGATPLNFTISLSPANSRPVTLGVRTATAPTLPATSGVDYTAKTQSLSFAPGETSKIVPVSVLADLSDEENERIGLTLSAPVNATAGTVTPGTILDDDAAPSISIGDVREFEGANPGSISLKLRLSKPSGKTVTVKYQTVDATAVAAKDYHAVAPTLATFTPGQTVKYISIPFLGDQLDELDEYFLVKLLTPTNATLGDGVGQATLVDDDLARISYIGSAVTEGNTAAVPMNFQVRLSNASDRSLKATFSGYTATSQATAGEDVLVLPTTDVVFAPGETVKNLTVSVNGDYLDEANEEVWPKITFFTNTAAGAPCQPGVITDDDNTPKLSIRDQVAPVTDGIQIVPVTLTLSTPSLSAIEVRYRTQSDTAHDGTDYIGVPDSTVTFAPGENVKTIDCTVLRNIEINQRFQVLVEADPASVTVVDGQANVVIEGTMNLEPEAMDDHERASPEYRNAGDAVSFTVDVLENDYDMDGDPLTITAIGSSMYPNAIVKLTPDQQIQYTLPFLTPGDYGDVIWYTISDGVLTNTSYVEFYFGTLPNQEPSVMDDTFNDGKTYMPQDAYEAEFDVLQNDIDWDFTPLRITAVRGPFGDFVPGTATVENLYGGVMLLKVKHLPASGTPITFEYDVTDGFVTVTGTATVTYNLSNFLRKPVKKSGSGQSF